MLVLRREPSDGAGQASYDFIATVVGIGLNFVRRKRYISHLPDSSGKNESSVGSNRATCNATVLAPVESHIQSKVLNPHFTAELRRSVAGAWPEH